jgi:hypothetical protein
VPALPLTCWRTRVPFPSFDASCNAQSDCFMAMHTTDCCGSLVAVGFNVSAKAQFDSAESSCGGPMCQCAPRPTLAQDGRTNDTDNIAVQCSNHSCFTWVP